MNNQAGAETCLHPSGIAILNARRRFGASSQHVKCAEELYLINDY